ncbi:hypothetical protein GYMLUDRAFT_59255 [Collybiopsis luxurians FD-317 M1]|uniref:Uncharacterized protein n=1 Tax=Collybiopsis luxurians FD-317 M1 TaxID=944289 RepID=A0A0D0CPP6_9AGAR|nr:hypothetical protein GYMLUDRAFT_59255 [Collybiopsis luxurians FD-317 M1]
MPSKSASRWKAYFEENPTFIQFLPNFVSIHPLACTLSGLILARERETGSTKVKEFVTCIDGSTKHKFSVNLGLIKPSEKGTLSLRRCKACIHQNKPDHLVWNPHELLALEGRFLSWMRTCSPRWQAVRALKKACTQISEAAMDEWMLDVEIAQQLQELRDHLNIELAKFEEE